MTPFGIRLLVRPLTAIAGIVSLVCVSCGAGKESCESGDRVFESGSTWTCLDGCNTCSCDDGVTSSTSKGCPTPPDPAANKLHCWDDEGNGHPHDQRWPCELGCGQCTCDDGDIVENSTACETQGDAGS